MSWDQEYTVPSFEVLLQRLAGISGTQLLIDHLEAKGIKIVDVEEVLLGNGIGGDASGAKVRLSDGRVYIPKLVERVTANGNYGNDIYEWFLIEDEPEVVHIDASDLVASPEEIASAEAELAPSGELFTEEDEDECLSSGCGDDGCGCGW